MRALHAVHLREPAADGPHVDDGLTRLDAEKLHGLDRLADRVALLVLGGASRRSEGRAHAGRLLVLRDLFQLDVGAYTLYSHLVAINTVSHMVGPYRLPHLDVRLESVYTHRVPTGAYRGAGRPQGAFVIERAMDRLAGSLGLDPAEVRARNLVPAEAMPP